MQKFKTGDRVRVGAQGIIGTVALCVDNRVLVNIDKFGYLYFLENKLEKVEENE